MKPDSAAVSSALVALRLERLLRLAAQAGWPTLLGLLAGACGLAMLVAAWHYEKQARGLREPLASEMPGYSIERRQFARATEAVFTVPEDGSHIDDLKLLFKLAKAKGVNIGTVEYRQEPNPSLQVLIRTLDIRIHEDYPKLKSFVADLLGSMPHASLQEIRVDRKDAATRQGQVLLKLAFVYRVSGPAPALTKALP